MTKVDLLHNLRVKFNELSLREHVIVEEVIKELTNKLKCCQKGRKTETNNGFMGKQNLKKVLTSPLLSVKIKLSKA